ncbi:hypothetical protein NGI46_11105 [Peribacillus butanolivorans]|nr:hypothetical protein [Peribacillus butanolivorans]
MAFSYVFRPRVVTVVKNPAYPVAVQQLNNEKKMPDGIQNKAKEISGQHREIGFSVH